ncbi:MAG: LytTR family DNA-binding domain-containing protein [Bacillota bacterium]|nr:LytTR family DNA-binding domain-containing protein [Bacillota bacterium]
MLRVLLVDAVAGVGSGEQSVGALLSFALTDKRLPISECTTVSDLQSAARYVAQATNYDLLIASFAGNESPYIDYVRQLRDVNEGIFVLFIVGEDIDIGACIRPAVRPSGILRIPPGEEKLYRTIREVHVEWEHRRQIRQPVFTVKSGGDYFSIETEEIVFFEAQGKKMAIKTSGQEILFYSSFDQVLEQLPPWFIRCHKGYVVNTRKIVQANFTDMLLRLKDRSQIPVSRTYRDDVREAILAKGGQGA